MVNNNIRKACLGDTERIQDLIRQLGYNISLEDMNSKMVNLLQSNSDEIYVYESDSEIHGVISLHFSIELAFQKDFMTIGYFVVDEKSRGLKIGDKLINYAEQRAHARNCELIEVFSREERTDAHRFYLNHGYKVVSKLFAKELK